MSDDAWVGDRDEGGLIVPFAIDDDTGDCPSVLVLDHPEWGFLCTRDAGHPGRHFAGVLTPRVVVAAWPGTHEPTEADLST